MLKSKKKNGCPGHQKKSNTYYYLTDGNVSRSGSYLSNREVNMAISFVDAFLFTIISLSVFHINWGAPVLVLVHKLNQHVVLMCPYVFFWRTILFSSLLYSHMVYSWLLSRKCSYFSSAFRFDHILFLNVLFNKNCSISCRDNSGVCLELHNHVFENLLENMKKKAKQHKTGRKKRRT